MRALSQPLGGEVAKTVGLDGNVDFRTFEVPGGSVLALSRITDAEVARRTIWGLGAVVDRPLLEAFGQLPLGFPVRWDDVDPLVQVQLDLAPRGCLLAEARWVTRLVQPVLDPALFVAAGSSVRDVDRLSLFAADAQRLLIVGRTPSASFRTLAREVGVGVAVISGGSVELLDAPSARFVRPGPRRWFVQERLWAASAQRAGDQALR